MANQKTLPTTASVADFLASVTPNKRRIDGEELAVIFRQTTGVEPVMWGPSMIGFGQYSYSYDSKHSGIWPKVAFSPRRDRISLYGLKNNTQQVELLPRLGSFTEGVGCVYVKKLEDIDHMVLRELIILSFSRPDRLSESTD
ncbi:hypothetical protein GCM10027417_10350 [Glutamicibacter endophyticus]